MSTEPTIKRFILLGDAGAGKSSFINFLYNKYNGTRDVKRIFCDNPEVKLAIPCPNWTTCLDPKYQNDHSERNIDDQTQSQTQTCKVYAFQGKKGHFEIIDTPGFNDTNGLEVDQKNLNSIESILKEQSHLNGIIIVINGALPRIGVSFKNFLYLLYQVWPDSLIKNSVAILTNCDSLSVNLDTSVLQEHLNIDGSRTFCLQNSLFKWNRSMTSKKAISRFEQDFEDNMETVRQLESTLSEFNEVSIEKFSASAIKIGLIEECIKATLKKIMELISTYTDQRVTEDSIKGAHDTMDRNRDWEKQRQINVIQWEEHPSNNRASNYYKADEPSHNHDGRNHHRHGDFNGNKHEKPHPQNHDDVDERHGNLERSNSSSNAVPMHDRGVKKHRSPSDTTPVPMCNNDNRYRVLHDYKNKQQWNSYPSPIYHDYSKYHLGYSRSQHSVYGPVYQPISAKVTVTLPNNEAISHHNYAEQQAHALKSEAERLIRQETSLKRKIDDLLAELKQQTAELRSINKKYDIIGRNQDLLKKFETKLRTFDGSGKILGFYYDQTMEILSGRSS